MLNFECDIYAMWKPRPVDRKPARHGYWVCKDNFGSGLISGALEMMSMSVKNDIQKKLTFGEQACAIFDVDRALVGMYE